MTKKQKNIVSGWDLWAENWEYAKRFFDSKGNIKTKSKLKQEWFNQVKRIIQKSYKQGLADAFKLKKIK